MRGKGGDDRLGTLVRERWRGEDAARGARGPDWREFAGTLGQWRTGAVGREWNGSQPGQGATELGFPRPMLGKMQGEAARRAGDPSHQSEDPPPEAPVTVSNGGCAPFPVSRQDTPGVASGDNHRRGCLVQCHVLSEQTVQNLKSCLFFLSQCHILHGVNVTLMPAS